MQHSIAALQGRAKLRRLAQVAGYEFSVFRNMSKIRGLACQKAKLCALPCSERRDMRANETRGSCDEEIHALETSCHLLTYDLQHGNRRFASIILKENLLLGLDTRSSAKGAPLYQPARWSGIRSIKR